MKIFLSLIISCLLLGCAKSKPEFGETFPEPPRKKNTKVAASKSRELTTRKSATEQASTSTTTKPKTKSKAASKAKPTAPETGPVVTPSTGTEGRIALVNSGARFVILSFPVGEVAEPEKRMNVYRAGLKVAELRVTGPQRDNNTAADIVAGDPQVNDEVREN